MLLKEVPTKIITSIGSQKCPKPMSHIIRGVCTHSSGVKNMVKLEEQGLLVSEKKGRKRIFSLTDKGVVVCSLIKELESLKL